MIITNGCYFLEQDACPKVPGDLGEILDLLPKGKEQLALLQTLYGWYIWVILHNIEYKC